MINTKLFSRKKCPNLHQSKQSELQHKHKKSTNNLALFNKHKISDNQSQPQPQKKIKEQKKLVHSTSKTKLIKPQLKSEKTDQNINTINFKKSLEKNITKAKTSRPKKLIDEGQFAKKEQKTRNLATQHTMIKINSQAKLNPKKVLKKKQDLKDLHGEKACQRIGSKTLTRNPTSKKVLSIKIKVKNQANCQPQWQQSQRRKSSSKMKLRRKNKISEIIQRSILYSDVNYDFQQQISLLGSGIKQQQDFYLADPFQQSDNSGKQFLEKRKIQNLAAITIQRYYRGYIIRKYINDARIVIDSIKTIQRFWRGALARKRLSKKLADKKEQQNPRAQNSASLITIKDLNDTSKVSKKNLVIQQLQTKITTNAQDANKEILKQIINSLLHEENLNQSIKEKIRSAIGNQNTKKQPIQKCYNSLEYEKISIKPANKTISQLQLDCNPSNLELSKEFYVRKKIDMEINSERYFNSPMNSCNHYLASPSVKKITSPKCFSNSIGKDPKINYSNYFRSTKNSLFSSPERGFSLQNSAQRIPKQQQEPKKEKENLLNESSHESNKAQCMSAQLDKEITQLNKKQLFSKEDYLFNCEIESTSPILQFAQNQVSDTQLLESQQNCEIQTKRTPKQTKHRQFPTQFGFIEQFCLLITDYLRDGQQNAEVFLEKTKGLKLYRLEKIFKQWSQLQFQESISQNQPLRRMILLSSCERPVIFSKLEKKMLIEYPSLRLFLNQNDYVDTEIFLEGSPQSSYIKFMFDAFEESLFENFKYVTIQNLGFIIAKESKKDVDYMSVVLSETMGNMLRSAQMLCGSFETEDMTEAEKEQRQMINLSRETELIKEFNCEPFDVELCCMWINLLLGRLVFQQMVEQIGEIIDRKRDL